jgi:hypothetical protein
MLPFFLLLLPGAQQVRKNDHDPAAVFLDTTCSPHSAAGIWCWRGGGVLREKSSTSAPPSLLEQNPHDDILLHERPHQQYITTIFHEVTLC